MILEAMACGAPVIASDIPEHREIVKDNITGYLFKAGDENDLAGKILEAFGDKNKRRFISFNARTLIEEQYSWGMVAKRLDQIYEIGLMKI